LMSISYFGFSSSNFLRLLLSSFCISSINFYLNLFSHTNAS
jgi:hypothetical protein